MKKEPAKSDAVVQKDEAPQMQIFSDVHIAYPANRATGLLYEYFANGLSGIRELAERDKALSKGSHKLDVFEDDKNHKVVIRYVSADNTSEVDLEFSGNAYNDASYFKGVKKVLVFICSKLASCVSADGTAWKNTVTFPLGELVRLGAYSDTHNARRGVEDAAEVLTWVRLKGSLYGEDDSRMIRKYVSPFKATIENAIATVTIDKDINIPSFVRFYMMVPDYYYRLSSKAADFLMMTCQRLRYGTRDVAKNGSVTMSVRSIQQYLGLPSMDGPDGERKTRNPGRVIVKPVLNAIVEIEKAQKDSGMMDFTFRVVGDTKKARTFIESGFIVATPIGEYLERLESITTRRKKAIERRIARKTTAIPDGAVFG